MEINHPTDEELRDFLLKKYLEEQFQNEINGSNQKDIKQHEELLKEVTPEIFFRFLSEKGVSGACISCGSSKLSAPENRVICIDKIPDDFKKLTKEEQHNVVKGLAQRYVAYVAFGDTNTPSGVSSYYMVHCLNCGYLSLYRTSEVLKWLEKNNVQDDNNG
ncbi:TPA: hypothetical protein ACYQQO_002014 [Escherichia coli]|uniref:hypothetical protein n=1 Tax=Escherichia coli TaxID=562 RepID=UPI000D6A27D4|nr:hypothetical protein [Escherichia coli]EFJ2947432.1 hypothetical protein [Escherichia coli]EHK6138201.1 hypothetical protein [Escherichia coli]EHR9385452.1 hypothetical protein [Escherichia coli]HCB7199710.1 hypothetical protein [Escherichia coli]HEI2344183.1 hypothetical protein [Escherichia coli]